MLYLVTGGSGSGKSEYAENLAVKLHAEKQNKTNLYYIAAMKSYDEECDKRIARHRRMRRGKGFTTIECYLRLEQLQFSDGDTLLLECMSNLLANEMYEKNGSIPPMDSQGEENAKKAIVQPILRFANHCDVVIVTNEVFSDGAVYTAETAYYVSLLANINRRLAEESVAVVEVVCSIPVIQKGEIQCGNHLS